MHYWSIRRTSWSTGRHGWWTARAVGTTAGNPNVAIYIDFDRRARGRPPPPCSALDHGTGAHCSAYSYPYRLVPRLPHKVWCASTWSKAKSMAIRPADGPINQTLGSRNILPDVIPLRYIYIIVIAAYIIIICACPVTKRALRQHTCGSRLNLPARYTHPCSYIYRYKGWSDDDDDNVCLRFQTSRKYVYSAYRYEYDKVV